MGVVVVVVKNKKGQTGSGRASWSTASLIIPSSALGPPILVGFSPPALRSLAPNGSRSARRSGLTWSTAFLFRRTP